MALSRLRLSSHCLNIEVGRYHPRVPRHRRYCTQCNTLDIEDEYHFILICSKYRQIRLLHIPPYYRVNTNMAKFIQLMIVVQEDHNISHNVSVYIKKTVCLYKKISSNQGIIVEVFICKKKVYQLYVQDFEYPCFCM